MKTEPLTPAVTHVLLALVDEDRHGYAIMRDGEARAGYRMGPGTLYGTIRRLLDAGLVAEAGACEEDPRRRLYRLTEAGRTALAAEVARLDALLQHPAASRMLREARA